MDEKKIDISIWILTEILFWGTTLGIAGYLWSRPEMKSALLPTAGFFGGGFIGFLIMWHSDPWNWKDKIKFLTLMRIALSIALFYLYLFFFFTK